MSNSIGTAMMATNDFGWVTIDPSSDTWTKGITQAFQTGELWGINSQVFSTSIRFRLRCSKCGKRPTETRPDWSQYRARGRL
jgi:hypothetical protein